MNPKTLVGAIAGLCLLLAMLLGGGAPFGRLAMTFGLPQAATHLFGDPVWQGVARSKSGDMVGAAFDFEEAGPLSGFNAGTAFAFAGEYAKALEVLDAHLLIFPNDHEAQENYELIRSYYAGTLIEPESEIITKKDRDGAVLAAEIGQGSARAASTGSKSNNRSSGLLLPTMMGRGREGVRQVFDDYFYEANLKWLKSMTDLPGEYLAARIEHEHKERAKRGIGQPQSEDPE